MVRRIEETADVISLVLEPADGGELPQIRPGQYVSVFVDLPDGDRQPRQYTVSSTAFGTRLQITVRRVRGANGAPDGRVSSYLHDNLHDGDVLDVSAPAGDFVLDPSDGPLLLASAGAGITTVLPIIEHIARTQPERTVIVAHADRTAQDHALRDTVLHVARHIDNFTAYTWYETVDSDDDRSQQGLMDLSQIPLPDGIQVFTCGPLPFMRHVRSDLLARGVPASRIRYEVFGPDLWAAQAVEEPATESATRNRPRNRHWPDPRTRAPAGGRSQLAAGPSMSSTTQHRPSPGSRRAATRPSPARSATARSTARFIPQISAV